MPGRLSYWAGVNSFSESQRRCHRVPNLGPGIEDRESQSSLCQVISHDESGLATSDHQHIERFAVESRSLHARRTIH